MRDRDKILLGAVAGAGMLWGARAILRSRRRIDLAGRVVIVTGASSGHGYLVARQAAERGARLVLAARHFDALRQAEVELLQLGAPEVLALGADVTDPEQVQEMVDQTMARFGRIDVLINNAGIITVGPAETMTLDEFRAAMDVNFWGAVHASTAVAPHMKNQGFGRIGNVVSIGGLVAVPHLLPYTASKFALTGFTRGLRAELARDNILVTGVYPSTMRTGGHTHAWIKGNREQEYAWFAMSDTLPVVSVSAERAARALWNGVCDGVPELIVGWPARLAVVAQSLVPNEMAEIMALMDRALPSPAEKDGHPVQGQYLGGTIPDLLNQAIPPETRPGDGTRIH